MNDLKIEVCERRSESGRVVRLFRVVIDGTDIVEMLRQHELPMAEAEGHPEIAGSYARYFVSETEQHGFVPTGESPERTELLECECSSPGCWPLLATIEHDGHVFRWHSFEQPHRVGERQYTDFGPFEFDETQYSREVQKLLRG